jgi:hypothetical protein
MDIDNDLLVARQSREKRPFWVKMANLAPKKEIIKGL